MASDTSLVFNILAKDQASKTIGTIRGNIDKLAVGIAGLAVGAGAGLAQVGGQFNEAFNEIRVATGAVGDDLEGLKQDFKTALEDTPADMQTVASALGELHGATGATGDVLQDMTTQVADASRLLGEDGTANAEAFGKAMSQWQVPAEEGSSKLDTLFGATQEYGVGLGEVTEQLNEYGAVLQNAGFSMEESTALFGQLEASGLSVSRVMPGLNMAFRNWSDEGKNLGSELEKTVGQIEGAESETEALAIATEEFGAEGAQRMTTAVRSGALELDDLSGALEGADGLIGDTAEETDGWKEKLDQLKNEGLAAVEPAASAVFDILGDGVDILASVVEWGERNTGTVKALAIALGVIAGIIVTVSAGMKVYAGVMAVVRAATATWAAVQWLLNTALFASPITWIVLAIVALIAIIVLIATKTTWFQDLWGAVWGWVQDAAAAVGEWFMETFWKKWIKGSFEAIIGFAGDVRDSVVGFFLSMKDRIVELPGKIKDGFSSIFNVVTSPFRAAFNFVARSWNDTVGQLSWSVPDIPGMPGRGSTISAPTLPTLAQGGVATGPTLAMIGEGNRDEVVMPLPPGLDARDLASGGRRDEPPIVHVYIGDKELRDHVRVEVEEVGRDRDRQTKRQVRARTGVAV